MFMNCGATKRELAVALLLTVSCLVNSTALTAGSGAHIGLAGSYDTSNAGATGQYFLRRAGAFTMLAQLLLLVSLTQLAVSHGQIVLPGAAVGRYLKSWSV